MTPDKNWLKGLPQAELDRLYTRVCAEKEARKEATKANAWKKVQEAMKEFLGTGTVLEIQGPDNEIFFDEGNLDMTEPGYFSYKF